MPIEYKKTKVVFRDLIKVEEAEGLLEFLQAHPRAPADLGPCLHLHPAALQVLLAAGCPVSAWPQDPDLRTWLEPLFPAPPQGGTHGENHPAGR